MFCDMIFGAFFCAILKKNGKTFHLRSFFIIFEFLQNVSGIEYIYVNNSGFSSPKKLFISVVLGVLSLALIGFRITTDIGNITYSIPVSVIFSLLVALAYGKYYGLLSGLSGAAFYGFALWPHEGLTNLLVVIYMLGLLYLLGTVIRKKPGQKYSEVFKRVAGIGVYNFIALGLMYVLYNPVLSLNAYLEAEAVKVFIEPEVLLGFWVKDSINFSFLVIAAELLLYLPPLRRMFGLDVTAVMKKNTALFLRTMAVASVIWLIFVAFSALLTEAEREFKKEQIFIAFFTIMYSVVVVAGIIIRFVNRQYQYQHELAQQNRVYEQLNQELKTANLNLEDAKNKAVQSERLKSAFLSNITHEIRTPMNGIFGFAGLLKEEVKEPVHKRYVDLILTSSSRLLQTINDVLDMAKIESGEVNLNVSAFEVNTLLSELYDFFIELRSDEVELILHRHREESLMIHADKTKLYQILSNLVNNALKFTKQGQVVLGARSEDTELVFIVEDTGSGINKEEHKQIFERFRQSGFNREAGAGGTGLGLAIVKEYTRLMGGSIHLDSEPGKGTRFELRFPLKPIKQGTKPFKKT